MKHFILIGGLLFGLCIAPEIARASSGLFDIQTAENLATKEDDTCINMRGCGRRDKI